jgi:putative acetyltransferase
MSGEFQIREEAPGDISGIRTVHDRAFGGPDESRLVDRLRSDGLAVASIVAVAGDQIIGHALFSQLRIEQPNSSIAAVALAPVAVVPDWQRRGVGTALIETGVKRCAERGVSAVIVLGHPSYYPRFGFSAELATVLESPYAGPAFMALELIPGSLAGGGKVIYPEAFSLVD